MKFFPFDIRSILSIPIIYRLFSISIGGDVRSLYVDNYIRARKGDKILDIGCGCADILLHLPEVEYLGVDINQRYIDFARRRFGGRGTFLCKKIDRKDIAEYGSFNIVLALGLLHHLSDDDLLQFCELSRAALVPGGRLVTLDGCYQKGQSRITKFLLSRDRGKFVRTKEEYLSFVSRVFEKVEAHIHYDLLRIPYTLIIMECTA